MTVPARTHLARGSYACFQGVHVVYAAAALVALPFYVFFALRLSLCRGDVGSLKAILDAKRDAGRGVVQECYMGAFTRSAKSMVVDITVLVNNFLLVWWPHVAARRVCLG